MQLLQTFHKFVPRRTQQRAEILQKDLLDIFHKTLYLEEEVEL